MLNYKLKLKEELKEIKKLNKIYNNITVDLIIKK